MQQCHSRGGETACFVLKSIWTCSRPAGLEPFLFSSQTSRRIYERRFLREVFNLIPAVVSTSVVMAEQPDNSFDIIDSLPDQSLEGSDTTHAQGATGDLPLVQTLYEGPGKCRCCINWVDYLPANADADDESDK